jgi:hypothetical protein
MRPRPLRSRVAAILAGHHVDTTVDGFTITATCAHCGRRLVPTGSDRPTNITRQAHATCPGCDRRWTLTVTLTQADGPRLPWEPLARHLPGVVGDIARRLHVTPSTVRRWRDEGVPLEHADRVAIAAGVTPWNVWEASYSAAVDGEAA